MTEQTANARAEKGVQRIRLRRAVAQAADGFAKDTQRLAEYMSCERLKTDQVRSLENLAYSTDKLSDIFDLIKNQVGRGRWSVALGNDLIAELNGLKTIAENIAQEVDCSDTDLFRRVQLQLVREYVKQIAVHFLFRERVREDQELTA